MIKQAKIGLNSRSEANPYLENGFLPLITAPMNTVVNEENYQIFLDNKINVCLPRNPDLNWFTDKYFTSVSLNDFIKYYIDARGGEKFSKKVKVCIDTANGNMPKLHEAIRQAKKIHGNNLVIMSGNVSSIDAFSELAKTGVDYIRVGIGGGGACTTTTHTGVGQEDLKELIKKCRKYIDHYNYNYNLITNNEKEGEFSTKELDEIGTISHTKIVADGISSYINQHYFHRNGYAAINNLLYAGADLVMIGSIFNKALESAGDKYRQREGYKELFRKRPDSNLTPKQFIERYNILSKYRGMSTKEEQETYKEDIENLMHSEGKTLFNTVEYTLSEWINGVEGLLGNRHDDFPGFINALRSAMSYTGSHNLNNFLEWE